MNSEQMEKEIIAYLARTSIHETLTAQYWLFRKINGVEPVMMQVSRTLLPAFWKEMSEITGMSLDTLASYHSYGLQKAALQFVGLPQGTYVVSLAPNKEPMTL